MESFEFLADSYIGIGDKEKSKLYFDKFTLLKDSLNFASKNDSDATIKKMVAEKINEHNAISKKRLVVIGSLILIASIITIMLWRRKNKNLHKKYEIMISKIHSSKENSAVTSLEIIKNNDTKSSISIPDDTVKSLLKKLEKFEKSEKYLKKEASLTWLANNLNTNPRYLSEIIKTYKDKSFTNYINGLRIEYIIKKLYENPIYREYKINYLAEECGYMTPRVFVAAFKNEYDVTPSYFIEKLKQNEVNTPA
ncbi:helix-turn-helix domain-containing protein [Chryseobacterium soli]|uniref:helix-turn-helix domain-containing protein n=1 Tax=Chryseobacterium soli TaxID=445961 RepID=UPI00068AC68B|nr:helix-turn-helix domain-containing protein [Chryseobacterium soli]